MISESQERMVAIVAAQMLEAVEAVLDRWELAHAEIGEVTDSGELRAFTSDEVVGEIPARAPHRRVPPLRGRRGARRRRRREPSRAARADALVELLGRPPPRRAPSTAATTSSSARGPSGGPGLDAAVLRLRPSMRGLAVSLDGQGRIGRLDPFARRCARRARGGAQRRLRRRRAARAHGLPQLREPREAGDRVGARAGDRGDRARLRGARHPGRLRERLALQRDERPADPADADRRLRRARARTSAACRRPGARETSPPRAALR